MNTASNFVAAFKDLQADAHRTMQEKGWWDSRRKLEIAAAHHSPELCEFAKVTNQLSMLMLMVTEIAELADVILRIMDKAEAYGWDVAGAIIAKAEMNKGRAHMHGGKKA